MLFVSSETMSRFDGLWLASTSNDGTQVELGARVSCVNREPGPVHFCSCLDSAIPSQPYQHTQHTRDIPVHIPRRHCETGAHVKRQAACFQE